MLAGQTAPPRRGIALLAFALLAPALLVLLPAGSAAAGSSTSTAPTSARAASAVSAQDPAPTPLLPTDIPTDLDPLSPAAVPTADTPARSGPESGTTSAPASAPAAPATTTRPAAPRTGADEGGRPGRAGIVLMLLALVASMVAGARALRRVLHAWWSPQNLEATRFRPAPPGARMPRVSVLVPARDEATVLAETLDRLAASDHRDLQVLAIVGHDDVATLEVARAATARHPGRVHVVVDRTLPRSKPAALNAGLAQATGEVVAVVDAEDDVHPQLVSAAVGHLLTTGSGVLQTGLQQVTADRGWWALRACLSDHFLFRSELHALAARQVLPVAGSGVFFRRTLLKEVRGWDTTSLGDAELGIRLQARGALATVAYDPVLTTRGETPADVRALVRQRTRRDQGSLQVLRDGRWRELATQRQRRLAFRALAEPFVDAVLAPVPLVVLVLALLSVAPAWVGALALVPLVLRAMRLVVEAVGLREMGRDHGIAVGAGEQVLLVLSAAPYRLLLMVAAARAVGRELAGRRSWPATVHGATHRPPSGSAQVGGARSPRQSAAARSFPFPLGRGSQGGTDLESPELIDLREEILGPELHPDDGTQAASERSARTSTVGSSVASTVASTERQ